MLVGVIMWLTSPTTLKNCSTHFGIQPGIKFLKLENEQQESLKLPFLLAAVNFDGSNYSFKIQLGLTGRSGIQSWNRAGLKKNRKKKPGMTQRVDLVKPGQKPCYNPLTCFFLLK
jgi:hypothetical protein